VDAETQLVAAKVRIEGLETMLAAWKKRALEAEEALAGGTLSPRASVTDRDVTERVTNPVTGRHGRDADTRHEAVTERHAPASPRLARGCSDLLSDPSFSAPSTKEGEGDTPPFQSAEGERESVTNPVTGRHGRDADTRHEAVTEAPDDLVLEELRQGSDLYPEAHLEVVAARIRRAVLAEPCARRDGVTPAIAAMEGVTYAREQLTRFPQMTPASVLAAVEKHAVKHVLNDCRRGERRKVEPRPSGPGGGGQAIPKLYKAAIY